MTKDEKKQVIVQAVRDINEELGKEALKIKDVSSTGIAIRTEYSVLIDDLYDKISHINLTKERYYFFTDLEDDEPERDADKLVRGLNELSRQLADLQRLVGGQSE